MRRVLGAFLLSHLFILAGLVSLFLRVGFPYHRTVMFSALLMGIFPLAVAAWNRRELLSSGRRKLVKLLRPLRLHILVILVLLAVVYVVDVLTPDSDTRLLHMDIKEREVMVANDLSALYALRANLSMILNFATSSLFKNCKLRELGTSERVEMRGFWSNFLSLSMELDAVMLRYRAFYLVDRSRYPDIYDKAFLLAYGSFVTQFRAFLELSEMVENRPFLETFLNESVPDQGIEEDGFIKIRGRLVHPDSLLRLHAGEAYKRTCVTFSESERALWEAISDDYSWIIATQGRGISMFYDHPLDVFEKRVSRFFGPVQKGVAVRMSFMRGTTRPYFIKGELLSSISKRCLPGDILLERRSWHATNLGIPGFWPHSALYIGTPEERRDMFGRDVEKEIFALAPEVEGLLSGSTAKGNPIRIIESVRDGVILNSFEESANADYLAVLRPRVGEKGKLLAIATALTHKDKPYDYNFDFATDNAMVCSELIVKAYADVEGIDLMPDIYNGRLLLPANMIARKFAVEADRKDRQIDFIAFVDSSEKEGRAWVSNEESFKHTWKRPRVQITAH